MWSCNDRKREILLESRYEAPTKADIEEQRYKKRSRESDFREQRYATRHVAVAAVNRALQRFTRLYNLNHIPDAWLII